MCLGHFLTEKKRWVSQQGWLATKASATQLMKDKGRLRLSEPELKQSVVQKKESFEVPLRSYPSLKLRIQNLSVQISMLHS